MQRNDKLYNEVMDPDPDLQKKHSYTKNLIYDKLEGADFKYYNNILNF